jgi:hypothetical protein
MTLTAENLAILKRPFSRADHEFLQNFVYLTEEAITNRIEEVDPSWTFTIERADRIGDQSIVNATLTILDVSRTGVGMQKVNEKAGEPEKGAATDALKRCARLFGIGRYLLDAPKENEFNSWLAQKQKEYGLKPTAPPEVILIAGAPPPLTVKAGAKDASADPLAWVDEAAPGAKVTVLPTLDMKALYNRAMKAKIGVKNWAHFENLYELLASEKAITLQSSQDEVFEAMKAHEAQKEAVS